MSSSSFRPLGPAHYVPRDQDAEQENFAGRRVAVFFATREGHTQRIAERIAAGLRKHGCDVDLHDARCHFPFAFSHYNAAVLAASVHRGSHEKEMVRFVKEHRAELERIPTAFVSVTLSEAGVEKRDATPAEHAQFFADVFKMMDKFFEDTQWHPTYVKPVAGALLYSKYNFFLRLILKRIAAKVRADTDTTRNYDYTDWAGLDKFFDKFAEEVCCLRAPADSRSPRAVAATAERITSHA